MIFGSIGIRGHNGSKPQNQFWRDWGLTAEPKFKATGSAGEFAVGMISSGAPSHDAGHRLFQDPRTGTTMVLYGNIFGYMDGVPFLSGSEQGQKKVSVETFLVRGFSKFGPHIFQFINGSFVLFVHDARNNQFFIARDHLGIEPAFYGYKGKELYFSSHLHSLTGLPGWSKELNPAAVKRYLLFNYNPGFDTIYKGIKKIRPGYFLRIRGRDFQEIPFWSLSFKKPYSKPRETIKEELLDLLRDSVRIRSNDAGFRPGAFLSGGLDSSTVVSLLRENQSDPIYSFSFRCRGKTFDESEYARLVSKNYETRHREILFESNHLKKIVQVVAQSQEPFSDIGIEVASYLLAQAASSHVDYILTGDGGDELFGGHPVYLADRMATWFDRIPNPLQNLIAKVFQGFPDPDKKKSFTVKAKRFSYSLGFPSDLYSNRWRIYYKTNELKELLTDDYFEFMNDSYPLEDIRDIYREADGSDLLSKSLYGDYQTVVQFYLARMNMIRNFGLEGRYPLMDPRLVRYAARIPSDFKIDKDENTKAIFHQTMAGILPDEIVYRRDKLGHSVPFKNWMRNSPSVAELFQRFLSPDIVRKRGFFNPQKIEKLSSDHQNRKQNNSHRLWGLLVFELWCQKNLDRKTKPLPVALELV